MNAAGRLSDEPSWWSQNANSPRSPNIIAASVFGTPPLMWAMAAYIEARDPVVRVESRVRDAGTTEDAPATGRVARSNPEILVEVSSPSARTAFRCSRYVQRDDTVASGVWPLPKNDFAARFAAVAEHDAEQVRTSATTVALNNACPAAEIHLCLLARKRLDAAERQRLLGLQSGHTTPHAVVARLRLFAEILINPLGRGLSRCPVFMANEVSPG